MKNATLLAIALLAGAVTVTVASPARAQQMPDIPVCPHPCSVSPSLEPTADWGVGDCLALVPTVIAGPFAPALRAWLPTLQARSLPRSLPVAAREPDVSVRRTWTRAPRGAGR